mgnify:CR=1 FL=1|jgi:RNA polymerase sigma-70 factor (ECF subfamily)
MRTLDTSAASTLQDIAKTTEEPNAGSPNTLSAMLPAVYCELRRLGRTLLRTERGGHTLQPTAIVNEAYLRLAGVDIEIHDRKHCYLLLAQAMRRVLIDHARGKHREKRERPATGDLENAIASGLMGAHTIDVIDIDAALQALGAHSVEASEMVQLRYFFGVEDPELAALFNISEASVTRTLRFAKAWLNTYLSAHAAPQASASI